MRYLLSKLTFCIEVRITLTQSEGFHCKVFQIYLMYMTLMTELSCIHNFYLIRGMIRTRVFSGHADGLMMR